MGIFFKRDIGGKGLATEALVRIIKFAFNDLKLHKLTAGCDANNIASKRVMIKCGMTKEAELKKQHFHRSKWCDSLKFALLKDEWLKFTE